MDSNALEAAGLTAQALRELGPAMTQAIRRLADIQRNLLSDSAIPREVLEERTTMNRNLLQLLKQAATGIQGHLEDAKGNSDGAVPNLFILDPERQASHRAQAFSDFVKECSKLVAAIQSYANQQTASNSRAGADGFLASTESDRGR